MLIKYFYNFLFDLSLPIQLLIELNWVEFFFSINYNFSVKHDINFGIISFLRSICMSYFFATIMISSTFFYYIYIYVFVLIFILLFYYFLFFNEPITLLITLISLLLHGVWMLFWLNSEFFSMLILIVYIGAISVLFLFVIMLLNIREEIQFTNKIYKIFFCAIYFYTITWFINNDNMLISAIQFYGNYDWLLCNSYDNYDNLTINHLVCQPSIHVWNSNILNKVENDYGINTIFFIQTTNSFFNDMFIFSNLLYTTFSFHFVVLGILLLLAMVGSLAILLSL